VKTPEDLRRENVKEIFEKRLKNKVIKLKPLSIKIEESGPNAQTSVDFSFERCSSNRKKIYSFEEIKGSGFVDAVFKTCYNTFIKDFKSLRNISLVDLIVKPIFSRGKNTSGSDAKTDIIFRLETKNHGMAEFSSRSRSIVYSSYTVTLEAFEFYMNCDKTFRVLKRALQDAQERNRADIADHCISDLTTLTKINSYA
jgi:hypothetical protein